MSEAPKPAPLWAFTVGAGGSAPRGLCWLLPLPTFGSFFHPLPVTS